MTYVAPTVRILSLDAAGDAQAGFAQIKIIRALMKEIWKQNDTDRAGPTNRDIDVMKPSDYFDIIFGSGTGGIIAVYLGRLHLTLEECERCYKELGERVYAHPNKVWNPFQYKYDSKRLESVLKGQLTDEITQDFADKDTGCKAVVLTKMSDNTESAHLVKSYDIQSGKTWEAIRAVTASRYNFPCVKVGGHLLFAAETGFSNPTGVAWNEARKRYPPLKRRNDVYSPTRGICLISIGSGTRPPIQLHMKGIEAPRWSVEWSLYWTKKLFFLGMALCFALIGRATHVPQVRELAGVASDCESTHEELERRFNFRDRSTFEDLGRSFIPEKSGYFRFNFDPYQVPIAEPEVVESKEEVEPSSSTLVMVVASLRRGGSFLFSLWRKKDEYEKWNRRRLLIEQLLSQEYLSQDADVKTMNKLVSAATLLVADIPARA